MRATCIAVLNGLLSMVPNLHGDWFELGIPRGSVLGPLVFLMYINDLGHGIKSNIKFFADDTPLFSIVHDPEITSYELDLINNLAFQWKMSFKPDPPKQAVQLIFSHKAHYTR